MKALIVSVILVLVALCVGSLTLAAQADSYGLEGTYLVSGTNPDGTFYDGYATLSEAGGIYSVEWKIGGTDVTGIGVGLHEGSTLAVIFQTVDGIVGIAAYGISGGKLVGHWHVPGVEGVFTETFTKTDPEAQPSDKQV